jgi:hypothetical protein
MPLITVGLSSPVLLQPIVFHNNLAAVGGAMFIADGSPAMLTGAVNRHTNTPG